jgi:hypothetical protein
MPVIHSTRSAAVSTQCRLEAPPFQRMPSPALLTAPKLQMELHTDSDAERHGIAVSYSKRLVKEFRPVRPDAAEI